MAIVTRFFSTTGAGAADGTTWADRAELDPATLWSTVITGFAFNGADSLKAYIGPGTYTFSVTLASALFVNPPTVANPLVLAACDSSGNALAIPDPDWVSAAPAFTDTTLPVLDTTTNIATSSLANTVWYLLKLTASGRQGSIISAGLMNWGVVINSTANTSAAAIAINASNTYAACTGSSYSAVSTGPTLLLNVRLEGVTGSSGNRHGVAGSNSTATLSRVTIVGVGGDGVNVSSSSTAQSYRFNRLTIANIGGTGLKPNSTAAQTANYEAHGCMITGCGAFGIDPQSEANFLVTSSRLRDNTSGNFGTFDNYPTDLDIYTTDSDDATEYVNSAGGDYRIKNTASLVWGKGYGVKDEAAAGTALLRHPGMNGGLNG